MSPVLENQVNMLIFSFESRSMGDVDGPIVAQKVYEQVFSGDSQYLDTEIVPYALDEATQQLRAEGLHPSRWAPYIHLGI